MLLTNNSGLEIELNANCMSTFNIDYNACIYYYDAASITLWLGIAYSGGTAIGGGLIAQFGIEIALMICQDTASSHYLDCFNGAVIL